MRVITHEWGEQAGEKLLQCIMDILFSKGEKNKKKQDRGKECKTQNIRNSKTAVNGSKQRTNTQDKNDRRRKARKKRSNKPSHKNLTRFLKQQKTKD